MLQSKENTSEELIAGFELSEGKIFTSLHRGNRFSVFMAWSKCYVGIFIRLGRSLLLLGVIANCGSVVLEGPGPSRYSCLHV
ncbi:uncharacterized protein [Cicer arietinum]|uniref:uncharacterized protein isoform X2 n=1 Tax=Cicer arietinum TaxID=3827 RepID=UPI003CC50F51